MSAPRTPRDELADATAHGDLYLRRLIRSQLGLSVVGLIAFAGFLGSLPLALYLIPGLEEIDVWGVPLPLLLIVLPPYPVFVAFGWLYARRAQALEQAFRDLVEPDR